MKKTPKYYEYRIEWVELTPEMKAYLFDNNLTKREFIEIGKSINYTEEYIRQIFTKKPDKLNKIIYDGLVAYIRNRFVNDPPSPVAVEKKADKPKAAAKKKVLSPFLQQRQKSKQATK